MRKPVLYLLYAIAATFGCFAVYTSLRGGSLLWALIWIVVLSPILFNALRAPKASSREQSANFPAQKHPTVVAERTATGLSDFFKALAILSLGLCVCFVLLAPFWVLAGFAIGYALVGALVSFGLAKAFE